MVMENGSGMSITFTTAASIAWNNARAGEHYPTGGLTVDEACSVVVTGNERLPE